MSYYVTNENSVLNINNAHLKVSGNVQTDVLKLGAMEFAPPASDVPGTVNFTNVTTGVTTTSNLNVGGTLQLGTVEVVATTHTLENTTALGNVTSNTIQFTNATTGIVATGNVEVGGELTVSGNVSDLNVVSNVNMLHTANTASIKLNSNVVTEFPRSKKLIKYPRVALTQNALNNGYAAEASSQESTSRQAWKVFNNTYIEGDGWRSWGQTYSSSDGSFTGTFVDFSNGGQTFIAADQGQWVKITLPEKMRLEHFRLQPRYSPTTGGATYSYGRSEFVKNGAIWGSNDGSSWDKVYTIAHGVAPDKTIAEFTVPNSTTAYNNFVLVVTDTHGSAAGLRTGLSEWELYGVPEYDSDAHGTDVVFKSDTNVPNTDFLDVFVDAGNTSGYNLSGSSVTSVTDLSSPANTMSVTGVTYDSTNKAFVFSGSSSSYIKATLVNGNGNYAHTLSAWFMMTDYSGSWRSIMGVGSNAQGQQSAIAYDPDQDQLYFGTYGADIYVPHKPDLGRWYHVAATFMGHETDSSTMNVYLNGVNMGGTPDGTQTPSFTGNQLCIGGTMNSGGTGANNPFKGQIANARFYRRAYTSDEIYQLYAHQKEEFGHGDLSMTLKAGRLGIGTSEPRVALDVRGIIRGSGLIIQTLSSYKSDTTMFSGSAGVTDISGLSVTIQPKFANSKILVSYDVNMSGKGRVYLRVKRVQAGNTSYFQSDQGAGGGPQTAYDGAATSTFAGDNTETQVHGFPFKCLDNAGGLNPITYTVQGWTNHSVYNVCINRGFVDTAGTYWGRCVSSITAQEVCQ